MRQNLKECFMRLAKTKPMKLIKKKRKLDLIVKKYFKEIKLHSPIHQNHRQLSKEY